MEVSTTKARPQLAVYAPLDRDVEVRNVVEDEVRELLVLLLADPADEGLLRERLAELVRGQAVLREEVVELVEGCVCCVGHGGCK